MTRPKHFAFGVALMIAVGCQADEDEADPEAAEKMICRDFISATKDCMFAVANGTHSDPAAGVIGCLYSCDYLALAGCIDHDVAHNAKSEAWASELLDDCIAFADAGDCQIDYAETNCLMYYFGVAPLLECFYPDEPRYVARATEALCAE